MLFKRQKLDWVLVTLLALGLFLYASYQPRFRLRTEMPADFIDSPPDRAAASPPQKAGTEEKLARAYWNCLVEDIQWKYGYGHILPVNPPPEFTALSDDPAQPDPSNPGSSQPGLTQVDEANRIRYWRRAQHVWFLPNAWHKDYEWDFNWTTDWIGEGAEGLHNFFQHLGGG